jgi:phage tail-like protein
MADVTEEYINATGFKVSLDGVNWDVFESVSNLGIDFEDIMYQSEKNQMLNRPGRYNSRDIHLTRRFRKDKQLFDWVKDLKAGKPTRKTGSIILYDDENKEVCRFNFDRAWPKSWSPPTLAKGANGNDILKEEIVLSVEDLNLVVS